MKPKKIGPPDIDSLIIEVRGQKVILGARLAAIYGVQTKNLNKAVKRNLRRFPEDFVFQFKPLRSQLVMLNNQGPLAGKNL